jgi:hypothetical protein
LAKYLLHFFAFLLIIPSAFGQVNIDHWESPILGTDAFFYWNGNTEPNSNWRSINFVPSNWNLGNGGFGYGDGDDQTVLQGANSVMVRRSFNLADKNDVKAVIFHLDYDDGFVAYLNGKQIARENMPSTSQFPLASEFALSNHEAKMYQGGTPDQFVIPANQIQNLLVNGNNTLAVQVHNVNSSSSDLSCIPFLTFGVSYSNQVFSNTPAWFNPPFSFSESHLPIVVINTNGQEIVDDPEILADMGVIDNPNGQVNKLTDSYNNYNGLISIELRGESSLVFDKKSYQVETIDALGNNNNVPLMGFPEENDWIFYGPFSDKTLLRNALTFEIGKRLNVYSSRTRFFELVIDGDYKGLYLLMEQIKQDKNRVDIAKLNPQDTIGEEITGGYIFRLDKIEPNGSPGFYSNPSPSFPNYNPNYFQFFDPKSDALNQLQKNYIESYLEETESVLAGPNFADPINGYQKYIDLTSFVDYQIINELTKNVDGYRFSTYFYKDKNDKIFAGPMWDFNLGYGNVDFWDEAVKTDGWIYPYGDRLWWTQRMLQDTTYSKALDCQWNYLRQGVLSEQGVNDLIDSMVTYLGPAIQRNYERWPVLGQYVWPNAFVGLTHKSEVNFLKNWIADRSAWLDLEWTYVCPAPPPPPVGSDEITDINTIKLYPNPAKDFLIFSGYLQGSYTITITDISGKILLQQSKQNLTQPTHISIDQLSSGIYFFNVKSNQFTYTTKFIKQ